MDKYRLHRIIKSSSHIIFDGEIINNSKKVIIKICNKSNKNGYNQIMNHWRFINGILKDCPIVPKGLELIQLDKQLILIEENVGISLNQFLVYNSISRLKNKIKEMLEFIHSKKVIHRDITLDNITIKYPNTENEQLFLIDFGIAIIDGEKQMNDRDYAQIDDDFNSLEYAFKIE